jgi:hypothetical protein
LHNLQLCVDIILEVNGEMCYDITEDSNMESARDGALKEGENGRVKQTRMRQVQIQGVHSDAPDREV